MVNVLVIVAGYLLGSISAAWIITRLFGKIDIRSAADGRISPASVYYRLGTLPYILAVFLDILFAATAVILAQAVTHSNTVAMLSGFAAMLGHNWSLFLKFKGGQGATTMTGALAAIMFWQLCCGLAVAALVVAITRRSTIATAIGICAVVIAAILKFGFTVSAFYPLGLFSIMLIKRLQLSRASKRDILNVSK